VWLDDRAVGTNDSLVAPHEYDLGVLPPGRHRVSIRVDNRMLLPYRPDAHSVSDSLGASWNGIVGKIALVSTPRVWIEEARVFSNIGKKSARIAMRIGNATGQAGSGTLTARVAGAGEAAPPASAVAQWATNGGTAEIEVILPRDARLWDEFTPELHTVAIQLATPAGTHEQTIPFGLREFKTQGQDFLINGRPAHLRGTHHGGDFPLTGYPPTDVDYWRRVFGVCKDWGLNHVRFHSFCPPQAAFTAADQVGLYLQIEPGMWNELSPGTPMERMLYTETERVLRAYGNHPSFVLCSASNEPKGAWKKSLPAWVEHFRAEDPRHLYTTGTGWSLIDEPGPVTGADYLAVHRIGGNMLRGNSAWFGRDYSRSLHGVNVPVVSHELGQWCAYPDFSVISKFTGYARPGNYEIFRDSAAAHGLLTRNPELARASGRFQLACYKEEIEANLRTPGLAGLQLLDLHDYTGQGTALVGLLDTFWDPKGYVGAEEFRQFCSPVVPLARLTRRVFTTEDTFEVGVDAANYGPAPITDARIRWRVVSAQGGIAEQGELARRTLPVGRTAALGHIKLDLSRLAVPRAYKLALTIEAGTGTTGDAAKAPRSFTNEWNFWVYPARDNAPASPEVLVTGSWEQAEGRLAAGGKVLFLPRPANLDWSSPPLEATPVFWNRLMNPGWSRMLGLWCDTSHPALSQFPTESACDWQWTDLLHRTRAVNLDKMPRELIPIVQAIDDWNRNYKLAVVFEAKVGPGRLLVCSADLESALDTRTVARQLRRSLVDYIASPRFEPKVSLSAVEVRKLWFDTREMRKLGAQAQVPGGDARTLLDGDPNTFWSVGGARGGAGAKPPYDITITFPSPVALDGLVLLNRQNDRDHLGDIRGYAVKASEDGQAWREVMAGELASTWKPQTIRFPGTVTTRQIKFTALSGFGKDTTASLAELAVLYAGPRLPENTEPLMEYQRARSTSSDVDEGGAAPQTPKPQRPKSN
jgi:hypothetical protein